MKKLILAGISIFFIGSSMAQDKNMDYSMETQKVIQRLKEEDGYKNFCKEYLDKIIPSDKIGKEVVSSTCVSDFFNFNTINDWGNEIYNIAMSNNKKPPATYDYALPVGKLDKELFLASNSLLSTMFWTSIDRYNKKVKSIPDKEPVTNEQYVFFNNIYQKLKDPTGKNLKPVMSKVFEVKDRNMKELRASKKFISYANSLAESKNLKTKQFANMDIIMNSFANYKEYLDFVYSRKMDEIVESPIKFKGTKFNKVQCAALNLALSPVEYDKLKKDSQFLCE